MTDAKSRPLLPDGCFWITDGEHLRVARNVGERDGMWRLDVFRNPDDAHAGKAMIRGGLFQTTDGSLVSGHVV